MSDNDLLPIFQNFTEDLSVSLFQFFYPNYTWISHWIEPYIDVFLNLKILIFVISTFTWYKANTNDIFAFQFLHNSNELCTYV